MYKRQVYSGAAEVRDGLDNDCDLTCDEGLISAGDLIVTEVMVNPSIATDPNGEWVELYNTTTTDIAICAGWTFADTTSTDRAVDTSFNVVVPAKGYATLAYESNTASNGGLVMDGEYHSTLNFSNSGGDTLTLKFNTVTIDTMTFTGSWPFGTGESMHLKASKHNATDNNTSTNWCKSTTAAGNGEKGTPGAAESGCP